MAEVNKRGIASKLWQALGVLLVLVVLLPFSLYIPWVQNIVKGYACEWASEETGLEITIDRILLKFPLDVSVDGLLVLDEHRDTMVQAGNLTAGVELLPLFSMDVNVDEAQLTAARYRMVAEDSSMVLRARVDYCKVQGIALDLDCNILNIADGTLRGGDVSLDYYPYKVVNTPDTTESKPWKIRAYHLGLEDINYSMSMLPTIDKLTVHLDNAMLVDGFVDTGEHIVNARSLRLDSAAVDYIYPSENFAAKYAELHPVPVDTLDIPGDTIPWTIRADSLMLNGAHIKYALSDEISPAGRGLNTDYIDVNNLDIKVDSFYNRGSDISLALRSLTFSEDGSGLKVNEGKGKITINDDLIRLDDVHLATLLSDINLDARVDMALIDNPKQGQVYVKTDSKIALQDVSKLVPSISPMLSTIPQASPLALKGDVKGNLQKVDISTLTAEIPRYARAQVSGSLTNPTDFDQMVGELKLDARFDNINFVKPTLLDKAMQNDVNFPPMSVNGTAKINRGTIAGDAVMTLASGKMVGKGTFNSKSSAYDLDATFNNFPLHAIYPLADADNLTAHVKLSGRGFDFMDPSADLNADISLAGVNYNKAFYKDLNTSISLKGGEMMGYITSANDNCRVNVDLRGTVNGRHYQLDASGNVFDLDLNALGLYDGECEGHGRFTGACDIDLDKKLYDATVNLRDFEWVLDGDHFIAEAADATFRSNNDTTEFSFDNEDNHINFASSYGLDPLIKSFTQSGDIAMGQYKRMSINIDTLQAALPPFKLNMKMGTDGLVQRYVQKYGIDFRQVSLDMKNDSNIFIDGYVHSLAMEGTNIDTLSLKATQWNKYLAFKAHMGNRPGTMDEFAQVTLMGGVKGSTLDVLATQHNIHNEMGYRLGCNATLTDTAVNMKLFPTEPVIGYRKWTMNEGNYINLNYETRMLDANLKLESDSSIVSLMTNRVPGATKESVLLNIDNLRIEEWTKFMPNMDPMSGVLDAKMDVDFDGHALEGKGVIDLQNFVYSGMKEGNFTINTDYGIDPSTGGTRINADMLVDGSRVAMAFGSMTEQDGNTPLSLDLNLDRFPLSKISPFIPGKMLRMRGYANGKVTLGGTMDSPVLNGYIVGDSAYVSLPRYGSSLKLCEDKLSITDNVIKFNDYRIIGLNDNAVKINGYVDARNLDNMVIDMSLRGKNIQFIGSEQRTFSEVFGKAYADLDASIKSSNNYMSIKADMALLSGSNITYVLQDEISSLTNSVDKNMVTFVNLNDSTGGMPNLVTSSATTATNILANIEIQQGAKINTFISTDGKDRASIDGSGRLKYSLDFAGKSTLTGTYTIETGNVRYTPPLIAQKNFTITSGSNVVWTGDMLNPQLNLQGIEHVKTSVTVGDQGSRPVDFLITANVGGTLGVIKLDFDMSSENDISVQNELQSMSDVQRSQAAINMLLYNTYSGTHSAGSVNGLTASAALFSFLQSQLNSWAAKTLKGVDLSFGINQYEGKNGKGTETSYSYRLSKNLFNDRFKIVVGGEYSTDASAEENFAQNLISDISFEYSLNSTGSRYVRLFRHNSFESMLEGQITETGVGFVMKRKVSSIKSLFQKSLFNKVNSADTVPVVRKEDETDSIVNEK